MVLPPGATPTHTHWPDLPTALGLVLERSRAPPEPGPAWGGPAPCSAEAPDHQRGVEVTDDLGQLPGDLESDGSFLQGCGGGGESLGTAPLWVREPCEQVMSGHDWDASKHLGGTRTRHRCLAERGVGNVHAAQYSQSTRTDGPGRLGLRQQWRAKANAPGWGGRHLDAMSLVVFYAGE